MRAERASDRIFGNDGFVVKKLSFVPMGQAGESETKWRRARDWHSGANGSDREAGDGGEEDWDYDFFESVNF